MKRLLTLLLLLAPSVLAQNPVSGGPIPQTTYNTPPVNANPTHGTGAPSGTCMSGVLYTNDSNGNLYSCNAGTWGLAGAAGTVTHTAGNLTAFHLMLGNGLADSTVDSACVTDGAGALSGCTSMSTGSGAAVCGAGTAGCIGYTGGAVSCTPTAGQGCQRYDSVTMKFLCSLDIVAEAPCASSALSALIAATASNTIANGNNPQTWNWAQTTDSQAGLTCGETSAATGGTIAANGSANQAACKTSTATNSTATPFSIEQGSITNTVATPAGQVRATWNNSGLHARGFGISITNTASNADSMPLFVNVGNSTLWGIDKTGSGVFNGNSTITSGPPASAAAGNGWKYCMDAVSKCVGIANSTEFHLIANGGNGWFSLSNTNPTNDAGSSSPDSTALMSIHNSVFMLMGKGHAGCGFTNRSASAFICGNSTSGEFSAATAGSSSLGMLVRTQPGAIHVTAQTATKTIYTLCAAAAGACNVAGQYRITWYFNQGGTACGTPTPGQVTFEISYTDNAGAHSAVALPMNDNSSIAVFTGAFKFAATNVTGFASGEFNLWSTGAQPIQVTNTYTACGVGTGTWELTATAERVQ